MIRTQQIYVMFTPSVLTWPSDTWNTVGMHDVLEGFSKSSAVSTPASRQVKAQQRLRRSFDHLEPYPNNSSNRDSGHFDSLNQVYLVPASQEDVLVKLLNGSHTAQMTICQWMSVTWTPACMPSEKNLLIIAQRLLLMLTRAVRWSTTSFR